MDMTNVRNKADREETVCRADGAEAVRVDEEGTGRVRVDGDEKSRNFVYIVRCSDGSYYTGWTNDLQKRIKNHNEGRQGAKYTRGRRPVTLVYSEEYATPEEAMSREWHIKRLTRCQKEKLIAGCRTSDAAAEPQETSKSRIKT